MKETFTLNAEGTYKVAIENEIYLGLASGLQNSILKTVERDFFMRKQGYIRNGNKLSPWEIEKLFVNGTELVPAGRWLEGKTLAEAGAEDLISVLFKLVSFFADLKKEGIIPKTISTNSIYLLKEGGVLLFPPSIMDFIASHREEEYLLKYREPFNHPDISDEKAVSFFLGVIAYLAFTGELPFTGTSITEIREKIRISRPVDIALKIPGLNTELSGLIMDSLLPSKKQTGIEYWQEIFSGLSIDDVIDNESYNENTDEMQKKALEMARKREKSFKRKQFFAKHWKVITAITAGILITVSIIYPPLKKALEPPITAGLPAEKVVEMYYQGYNSLDVEIMEDCTSSRTGKKDIKEVSGIFVISKVRKGYEGKSGIINAGDWMASGSNPLSPEESIFGLTDIDIRQISEDTFQVEYDRWFTEYSDTEEDSVKSVSPESIHVTDILHLSHNKEAWIIDRIDRKVKTD